MDPSDLIDPKRRALLWQAAALGTAPWVAACGGGAAGASSGPTKSSLPVTAPLPAPLPQPLPTPIPAPAPAPAPVPVPSRPVVIAGTIRSISLNTRADIDPSKDPLANPNFPDKAPWEDNRGGFLGWSHVTDFCGSLFVPTLGAAGTLLQYGGAGHSAVGAAFWFGFDVAERVWKRIGRRPLPSNMLVNFVLGSFPDPASFDHTWGDWNGAWSGWPAGFAQPGWNPPEGSHTRNSFVYRPPDAAGNVGGQVITCWEPTGVQGGTGIKGSHVWDVDTGLFVRTANLRPGSGNAVAGVQYSRAHDVVIGNNNVFSATTGVIDVLDCQTMTWMRRTATNDFVMKTDSTSFIFGDLFVNVDHSVTPAVPSFTLRAVAISDVVAGSPFTWATLSLNATSFPNNEAGITRTTQFEFCPVDGSFYAVNRIAGSNKIWKLTPPAPSEQTGNLLAGTWTLAEQTLVGGLLGTDFDYSRLRWCPAITAFLWTNSSISSDVQAIRPFNQ